MEGLLVALEELRVVSWEGHLSYSSCIDIRSFFYCPTGSRCRPRDQTRWSQDRGEEGRVARWVRAGG